MPKNAHRENQDSSEISELTPGKAIRQRFPIFRGPPRIKSGNYKKATHVPAHYLDSASTTHKPGEVIKVIADFLSYENANIHRGAYYLSADASQRYEAVRTKVANFIGAKEESSIVFTRGTTESINLVSHSLKSIFGPKDTLLLTVFEHHSNIIPWQLLAGERGAALQFVKGSSDFELDLLHLEKSLTQFKPKLVALTAISNVFGTKVPLKEVVAMAKRVGALVLIDAAQAISHQTTNVAELDCDFLAFSAHKMYGPTGAGVLYVKPDCYELMAPFMGGGGMIEWVEEQKSTWAEPPHKFEAGTPPIAEVLGLGRAVEFIESIGLRAIEDYETGLLQKGLELLAQEPKVKVYGPKLYGRPQAGIISFNIDGIHPHDLATIVDDFGVQIRAGHHCAMPLLKHYDIAAVARASVGVYSVSEDFEALIAGIRHAKKVMRV